MMPADTARHCTCAGCRRVYAERFGEPCECTRCTGPTGFHQSLYNRYRPQTFGVTEPKG